MFRNAAASPFRDSGFHPLAPSSDDSFSHPILPKPQPEPEPSDLLVLELKRQLAEAKEQVEEEKKKRIRALRSLEGVYQQHRNEEKKKYVTLEAKNAELVKALAEHKAKLDTEIKQCADEKQRADLLKLKVTELEAQAKKLQESAAIKAKAQASHGSKSVSLAAPLPPPSVSDEAAKIVSALRPMQSPIRYELISAEEEDLSQVKIIEKVNKYIIEVNRVNAELHKAEPAKHTLVVRELLNAQGVCHGIALYWLWLFDQHKENQYRQEARRIVNCADSRLLQSHQLFEKFIRNVTRGDRAELGIGPTVKWDNTDRILETKRIPDPAQPSQAYVPTTTEYKPVELEKKLEEFAPAQPLVVLTGKNAEPGHSIALGIRSYSPDSKPIYYYLLDPNDKTARHTVFTSIADVVSQATPLLTTKVGMKLTADGKLNVRIDPLISPSQQKAQAAATPPQNHAKTINPAASGPPANKSVTPDVSASPPSRPVIRGNTNIFFRPQPARVFPGRIKAVITGTTPSP
jgi:hypothetical protein